MNEIWLIDDDRIQNMINQKLLSRMYPDAKMTSFINPVIPLQKLIKGQSPEIIFLDINMPELNGFDFLENLVLRNLTANIILLSSSIDPNDVSRSDDYEQIKGYVSKPLTRDKLKTIKL